MALLRNNVTRALYAYNEQRVNSLAGSALFVKVKERCELRYPDKVRMLNLQSSAIGEMDREGAERREAYQLTNLLQHKASMRPAFIPCN